MAAAELNLTIEKGTTFKHTLIYMDSANVPIPLTNYVVKMQIRISYADNGLLAEFSTINQFITVNGTEGKIIIIVPASETDKYKWDDGVYDLVITSPAGDTTRLIYGTVDISPNITKVT